MLGDIKIAYILSILILLFSIIFLFKRLKKKNFDEFLSDYKMSNILNNSIYLSLIIFYIILLIEFLTLLIGLGCGILSGNCGESFLFFYPLIILKFLTKYFFMIFFVIILIFLIFNFPIKDSIKNLPSPYFFGIMTFILFWFSIGLITLGILFTGSIHSSSNPLISIFNYFLRNPGNEAYPIPLLDSTIFVILFYSLVGLFFIIKKDYLKYWVGLFIIV